MNSAWLCYCPLLWVFSCLWVPSHWLNTDKRTNNQQPLIASVSVFVPTGGETIHPGQHKQQHQSWEQDAASHLPLLGSASTAPGRKKSCPKGKYTLPLSPPCCTGLAAKGLKRKECFRHALQSARSLNMNDQIAFYFLN